MRAAAARAQCQNNLKQIALGGHQYHDAEGHWPVGTLPSEALPPEKRLSWQAALLPYLEQDGLYKALDRGAAWDGGKNATEARRPVRTFTCGIARSGNDEKTSYVGVAGVGADAATFPLRDARCGLFGYDRRVKQKDVADGLANTLLALDTSREPGAWAAGGGATVRGLDPQGQPYVARDGQFGLVHRDPPTIQFARLPVEASSAFADGSVRMLADKVSPGVLEALATIAGGETIEGEF